MATNDHSSGEPSGSGEPDLSKDESFDLLSNHRRRYALYCLMQNEEELTLGELADMVAAWENGVDTDAVSYEERKRVYTSLQQVHLPRMDDLDVVEFDDSEGRVTRDDAAEHLEGYLEVVRDDDIPWSVLYLGLALVNFGLVSGAIAGLFPLTLVSPFGWAVFAVTTFLVTSLSHLYLTRAEMRLEGTELPEGPGD